MTAPFRALRLFIAGVLGIASTIVPLPAATVTVFAAASLTDALKEIGANYQKQSSDTVLFNFAASSLLSRQIQEGAPADIFFSADEARMDALEKQALLVKETRKDRLANSLAIVVSADSAFNFSSAKDLAKPSVKRLALADPKVVPAGVYAREYLEKMNLWAAVETKVVPTENVRAALAAVESGNVDAGIVYKTDVALSRKARIAFEIPLNEGPKIRYPMALVRGSQQPAAARQFLAFLDSPEAGRVFERYGFILCK